MSTVISDIIRQVSQKEEDEKQRRQAKWQELLDVARQELRKVLDQVGGLYDELQPYIREDVDCKLGNGREDLAVDLDWIIQSDELQLAPMRFNLRLPNQGYRTRRITIDGAGSYEFASILQAIATSRDNYAAWKNAADKKFIEERSKFFHFSWGNGEDAMLSAYEELVARFPDRKSEFDLWVKRYRTDQADAAQSQQAYADEQQKKGAAQEEYLARWISYLTELARVQEANDLKARQLQAELDVPFTAWNLVYGLVGEEEGQPCVDVSEDWVRNGQPDEEGMYLLFDGKRVKYFHPVSISPRTVKPSDCIWGLYRKADYGEYGIVIVFDPDLERSTIDAIVAKFDFEKLPVRPDHPEILSWGQWEEIQVKATRIVEGLDPETKELPF
jgi:hypothetical protein